jgi:hypothetical protein
MRAAFLAVVLALAVSATALAGSGDPQTDIRPADQARARAMLLRLGDFSPAFTSRPSSSGGDSGFYCPAIDESDLTLTGKARSPTFAATIEFVTSTADVYESRADANASWVRGTSKAGQQCLRTGLRRVFQGSTLRFVSFKPLRFPRRGERSVAYRAIVTQDGVRIYIDVIAMLVSRAEAAVIYSSVLTPPPHSELRRLSGLVAKRAEKAMRGA